MSKKSSVLLLSLLFFSLGNVHASLGRIRMSEFFQEGSDARRQLEGREKRECWGIDSEKLQRFYDEEIDEAVRKLHIAELKAEEERQTACDRCMGKTVAVVVVCVTCLPIIVCSLYNVVGTLYSSR